MVPNTCQMSIVVRCFYTSIFLWGCGNFFTLIGNSIVFCVCGFEFSVKFCATDGGYFFLGVVLYLFAGLRNRRSSGPPGVAVHPKPWSTEVIFEIGARLYIGVGGVTCFRCVKMHAVKLRAYQVTSHVNTVN